MTEFRAIIIEKSGPVATLRLRPLRVSFNLEPYAEIHEEVGLALSELRLDDAIRIIVITGENDGQFLVPPTAEDYRKGGQDTRLRDPKSEWGRFTGCIRTHESLAEMEQIVIAKVNGDAFGFGQSIMFNSDFIVAREDAKICDLHLSLGDATHEGSRVGPPIGMTPGDGALSTAPFFMTPTQAKEYFMLGGIIPVKELHRMGIVNRCVPMAELEAETEKLIAALLARPRDVLAFTKRVLNRRVVANQNQTLDPALAYQMFNLRQILDATPR
jgi:enoyl-CoA hydratase/carnithine racemase